MLNTSIPSTQVWFSYVHAERTQKNPYVGEGTNFIGWGKLRLLGWAGAAL